ncbi:MFS transporter, partial [Pseudomonas sp.]|uniref:MFS transporter n=1 Tax=Pseudomonas sp. TaxID=306 RepID=UPI00261C8E50
ADLHTSIVATGQLVTIFALAYALSSPILTAVTGNQNRRRLMITTMAIFTVGNLFAWSAQNYWALMAARILLAFSAGLYVPGANALAGAVAGPGKRGAALAIVNGGLSIAVAFGVPLGALLGERLGWRATFAGVSILSLLATVGLIVGLPKSIGFGLPTASIQERIATAKQPIVLLTLLVTTLWAMGAYTVYTYLALFVTSATELHGEKIGYVLFTWGLAAAIGVAIGGKTVDRFGHRSVITPALVAMAAAFALLSVSAHWLPKAQALGPILLGVVLWGIAHWAFYPGQQAGLIEIAGAKGTPVALSLNASFMYLGFSLGAALGSITLGLASVSDLGYVGAMCEIAALILTAAVGSKLRHQKAAPLAA